MSKKEKYIYDLIQEGEHQQLDFKFEISSARKIAKTLVAFANTIGGKLLIGVKDNGKISGIKSDEEYYMIESATTRYCKPEIQFTSTKHQIEGKTILEIDIPESDQKPHLALDENDKWLAYHRIADESLLADYILLQVWKRRNSPKGTYIKYSENDEKLLNYLEVKQSSTLSEILSGIELKNKLIKQSLINLVSVDAIRMNYQNKECYYSLSDEE